MKKNLTGFGMQGEVGLRIKLLLMSLNYIHSFLEKQAIQIYALGFINMYATMCLTVFFFFSGKL